MFKGILETTSSIPLILVLEVTNAPVSTGDIRDEGSIPGSERSPGGGCGDPLQYSCLENLVYREAC